jgi:RNA polymerase primary sigma factor
LRQLKITQQLTVRDSKSINGYFSDINKIPMIDAEDEALLAERIQKGDKIALKKLVEGNLRFVVSVAKQYQNNGVPLEDLISEGNAGLIKAAEKFDHTKGFKFISYAVWWIRQSIMTCLSEHSRAIRMPANQLALLKKIREASIEFLQDEGREPNSRELSNMIDAPIEKIEWLQNNSLSTLSMDVKLSEDDKSSTLGDLLESGDVTDSNSIKESLSKDINDILEKLPYREAFVIKHYFGIGLNRSYTREEISSELELSMERTRQLQERAIRRIRKNGWSKLLLDYV